MLEHGAVVAGYRIERLLGRGGMGHVYLTTQLSLDRRVALKLIAPDLADDGGFRERFVNESRLAASIDHPHVIPVYEADERDGVLFLAMRYVDGPNLKELVGTHGRLEPARAVRIVAQVADALQAAHDRGLVHRDVKPANVLVAGGEGREHAYLTDFGLTKRSASESGLTQTGQWVGTLDYVAPEQLRGEAIDGRADVYALGCVLYEALTGRPPFPRDNDIAKLWAHISDPVPSPRALFPDIPQAIEDVVTRAMDKAPDHRFASAGELGEAAIAGAEGRTTHGARRSVTTVRTRVAPAAPTPSMASHTDAISRRGPGGVASEWVRRWLGPGGALLFVTAVIAFNFLVPEQAVPPDADAPVPEVVSYYAQHQVAGLVGNVLNAVIILPLVGFFISLYARLRRAEGPRATLATTTLVAAQAGVALAILAALLYAAPAFGDPGMARADVIKALWDLGVFVDALSFVGLSVFVSACSVVVLRSAALPRAFGAIGIVLGPLGMLSVLLILLGVGAAQQVRDAVFAVFVIWLCGISVVLLLGEHRSTDA